MKTLAISEMARPAGFEPTTFGSGGQHSIQLSYRRLFQQGVQYSPISVLSRSLRGHPPGITSSGASVAGTRGRSSRGKGLGSPRPGKNDQTEALPRGVDGVQTSVLPRSSSFFRNLKENFVKKFLFCNLENEHGNAR